jgi:hypothetical protein
MLIADSFEAGCWPSELATDRFLTDVTPLSHAVDVVYREWMAWDGEAEPLKIFHVANPRHCRLSAFNPCPNNPTLPFQEWMDRISQLPSTKPRFHRLRILFETYAANPEQQLAVLEKILFPAKSFHFELETLHERHSNLMDQEGGGPSPASPLTT